MKKPPVRLTKNMVEKLEPSPASGTKILAWDLMVPGFGAYKTSAGRISFLYQYRNNEGRTTSRKIGNLGELTIEQARGIASDWASERRHGIDPIARMKKEAADLKSKDDLLISNYFASYVARRAKRGQPMTPKQVKVFERDLVKPFGTVRMNTLTDDFIDEVIETLSDRGPSIVKSGLVCLRTLVDHAVKFGHIKSREAHDFAIPKTKKRAHRLSIMEAQRVLEASHDIGDVRSDVIEMILRTGKRKEEVAELPWNEIDLQSGQWKLPGSRNKSKRNKLIMLPRQVIDLLERQQPDPAKRHGPVFTLNGTTPCEMGSQVKDLIDANLHRRVELAAVPGQPLPVIEHWTVHDIRKIPSSVLREPPFRYSRDVINAVLLHRIGDDLDETYMLTELVEEAGEALQKWNDLVDQVAARPETWPGGRDLPNMSPADRARRLAELRVGWPQTASQKRAAAAAAAKPAPPRQDGRPASTGAAAVRKRRERAERKAA